MMELYRSEFKYVDVRTKLWAMDKEHETGIDKEIWVGDKEGGRERSICKA